MGGSRTVESGYGEGAIFGFTVDLESYAHQDRQSSANLENTRILLVNGPVGTQQVLNAYIASWGMRCDTATDVDKASLMLRHQAAANDPYHLVLVAFESNNLDPLNLLREVRSHPQLSKTKLVVIGSSADREFGRQAMADGFSAYLPLPVRQSRLFDCIANLVNLQSTLAAPTAGSDQAAQTKTLPVPEPRNLILVVEDNAVNQKVALLQLRELGLAAHAVGNGLEALEAVARTQYALILMDCQMPDMDGFQATSEIRKLEALTGKHSPIIAITAHALSSDRLECLAAGMDDYISKPVSQKRLAEVLHRWLPRSVRQPICLPDTAAGAASHALSQKPIELEVLYATYGGAIGYDLLREFQVSVDRLLQELSLAMKKQDAIKLRQLSHELKGVSATFYASELAELSRELEEIAREDKFNWDLIATHIKSIELAIARVKVVLQEQLGIQDRHH